MSGPISDLPLRVCPSCTAIFVQDDRMYFDSQICPRCGSDLSAEAREAGARLVRTAGKEVLGTEEGFALVTEDGFALLITPSGRWT